MPRNKDRLYIALFRHKREEVYHWAILVAPKANSEDTTRYHATNKLLMRDGILKSTWEVEERPLSRAEMTTLLVKVLIGKIRSSRLQFERSLRKVPLVQDDPTWTCRIWVKNVIERLAQDKILSKARLDRKLFAFCHRRKSHKDNGSITDWTIIETESRSYAGRKEEEERFKTWTETVPTYDLMAQHEIVA